MLGSWCVRGEALGSLRGEVIGSASEGTVKVTEGVSSLRVGLL